MTLFQALLIGLFAYLGSKRTPWFFGVTGGWNMIGRPLVAGLIVGIILGDVTNGVSALIAGSIVPFSSEAVLGLLLIAGYDSWGCVFSATLGNWLGGVTCYYIGYLGKTEWIHTYLKIPEEKLSKMQRFLKGKGSLFGFFVFIPVIGDIMIVALGLLRANPLGTLLSMMVGKFSRYYLVVIGINYLKEWFPNLF